MKEQIPNKRAIELQGYLHHVDIYLDKALPRAREEDARGNLVLDKFMDDCGTKGCVAFHFAKAAGLADQVMGKPYGSYIAWFDYEKLEEVLGFFDPSVTVAAWPRLEDIAFNGPSIPLDQRETSMREYRAELVTELESMGIAA